MSELLEILKLLRDIESLAAASPAPSAGVVGLDWRVCPVDATGAALGTLTNPVATTAGTASGTQTIGETAIAHGTNPTAVAAAAPTPLYASRAGVPFVIGGHPNIQTISTNYAAAQTDTALVTVATGLKIVVTGFMFTAHNANSVNVSVRIGFGTVNTPAYGAAQLIGTHPGVGPGSGFGRGSGSGIIGVGADDQDLRLTMSVPTGGSCDLTASFYTIES